MRLIDKDEILNQIGAIFNKFPERYDRETYEMIRREMKNKYREVKAIPIEWIKNEWLKRENNTGTIEFFPQPTFEEVMGWLIADWEKENEIS